MVFHIKRDSKDKPKIVWALIVCAGIALILYSVLPVECSSLIIDNYGLPDSSYWDPLVVIINGSGIGLSWMPVNLAGLKAGDELTYEWQNNLQGPDIWGRFVRRYQITGVYLTYLTGKYPPYTPQNDSMPISGTLTLPTYCAACSGWTFKANYKLQCRVNVTASTGGHASLAVGSYWYDNGTSQAITAIPDPPYIFSHWNVTEGVVVANPNSPSTTFTVMDTGTIQPVFKYPTRTLFLNVVGMDTDAVGTVVSLGHGAINYTRTDLNTSVEFLEGSEVEFWWISPVPSYPTKRYVWVSTEGTSTAQNGFILFGTSNATLTARYKVQYQVTVNSTPLGTTSPPAGTYWYDAGSTVNISVSAIPGYGFQYWKTTGGVTVASNSSSTTLTVNGPGTIAPYMASVSTVQLNVIGVGTDASGTILRLGDGTEYSRSQFNTTKDFVTWSVQNFSWRSPISAGTTKRYVWTATTGLSSVQSGNMTVPVGGGSLNGYYKTQYYVESSAGGGGSTSLASGWHDESSSVPITATPGAGFSFAGWVTAGGVSVANPFNPSSTMTVSGAGSIQATFYPLVSGVSFIQLGIGTDFSGAALTVDGTAIQRSELIKTYSWGIGSNHSFSWLSPLEVSSVKRYVWTATFGISSAQSGTVTTPSGSGSVTGAYATEYYVAFEAALGGTTDPAVGGWYREGQAFAITATPLANFAFANWTVTGAINVADPYASSTTFTASSPGTIRANFVSTLPPVTVNVLSSAGGSATPAGSWIYPIGTVVGIGATPSPGYRFTGWTAEGNVTVAEPASAHTTLSVMGPGTATAHFAPVDSTPPAITGLSPANGSTVAAGSTTISASFSDQTGINVSSATLILDGALVAGVHATSAGISYSCTLQPGGHTVVVTVSDTEGNLASAAWTFTATPPSSAFPTEYAVIAMVAIAAVAAAAFFLLKRKTLAPPPPGTAAQAPPSAGEVFCISCGSRNPGTAAFCHKCGKPIFKEKA